MWSLTEVPALPVKSDRTWLIGSPATGTLRPPSCVTMARMSPGRIRAADKKHAANAKEGRFERPAWRARRSEAQPAGRGEREQKDDATIQKGAQVSMQSETRGHASPETPRKCNQVGSDKTVGSD